MLRREDGFTLVELLIVVVTIGMITGAISVVIVNSLRVTDDTQARLDESADSQLLSAFFATDVNNADVFGGSCGTPSSGTNLITFSWIDPGSSVATGDDVTSVISYFVEETLEGSTVVRYSCEGSITPERTVLMDDVVSAATTCEKKEGSGRVTADCSGVDPDVVVFDAQICQQPPGGGCTLPPFDFQLRAHRRTTA